MRSTLILLLAACISGLATIKTSDAAYLEAEAISLTAESSPGLTVLTLEDHREVSAPEGIIRFVALPEGVTRPHAELQNADQGRVKLSVGKPMIARGLRLLPLTITPVQSDVEGKTVVAPASCRIEVQYGQETGETPPALRYSRGFFRPYAGLLAGGLETVPLAAGSGSYLIISAPEFVPAVEPLAAWKREKGFEVLLATTEDTGQTNGQIRDYIADLYHTQAVPPAYVLLVGDVDRLPAWDYHQSVSDHPYALVDGDDFLADLHVGRLSAANELEVETIVAKILRHERDPYIEAGTEWFTRGLVVAGDYGSSTPVPVSRWCREQMLQAGFTEVDSVYYPPHWGTGRILIKNAVDRGVSLVTYRGWAYGQRGWEPPFFTVDEIPGLRNGWMLPAVFSFVCQNNDFAWENPCFGEVWLRSGTVDEPRGAVAVIGNSEHWSHTRHNDAAAIGAFKAIGEGGVRRLGEILTAAKMEMLVKFPTEIYYEDHQDNAAEFYFYIYSLLGDPEMDLWITAPRAVDVSLPSTIGLGANAVDVEVTEPGGEVGIEGIRIGVTQGGALLGTGWTDPSGHAIASVSIEEADEPVLITVTGANIAPRQETIPVTASGPLPSIVDFVIDDDNEGQSSGNADGVVNPGETIELELTLRNHGDAPVDPFIANLSPSGWASTTTGEVNFAGIPAGGEVVSPEPFVIQVAADAEDNSSARLRLLGIYGGHFTSDIVLTATAPSLRFETASVDGEGVLLPGTTSQIVVLVHNDGSLRSSTTTATLRTLHPGYASIPDSTSTFGPIDPGGSGAAQTAFRVEVDEEAVTGQAIQFLLSCITDEGYVSETSFGLIVGPAAYYAPLGPDSYGYYAYDSADTDYPDAAPLYDWIYCSTEYGGSGTRLEIRDNKTQPLDLPFTFKYYGESYERILVSDNGWISFDLSRSDDFYNWQMPSSYGNGARVAAFWDNLDPKKGDDAEDQEANRELIHSDGIYVLHDEERHIFVVEWSRLPNHFADLDDAQTFELILFDPAYYPTPTGDGMIQFQYKQIVNNDIDRMYATIGIENETEDVGLQYTYSNTYPPAASPVSPGLAIRFTTHPAVYQPFDLADFAATGHSEGVMLTWEPIDDRPRGPYRVYRADQDGGAYRLISGIALDPSTRSFVDPQADTRGRYSYLIGSLDPVGRETKLGPFAYAGAPESALRVTLETQTPNPFRGALELSYSVPAKCPVRLGIYDISGRLVRTLVDRSVDAGAWNVTWDGRDDLGHDLPSGIYLCKMRAGGERRILKMTLLD